MRLATLMAATIAASGCQNFLRPATGGATATIAAASPAPIAATPAATTAEMSPAAAVTPEGLDEPAALAQIAPRLQQLAAADPVAHGELLQQLAASRPSLWPMTVERAWSTHLYRQQLAATSKPSGGVLVAGVASPAPVAAAAPPLRVADERSAQRPAAGAAPAVFAAPPAVEPAPLPAAASEEQGANAHGAVPAMIHNHHALAPDAPPAPETATIRLVSATTPASPLASPSPTTASLRQLPSPERQETPVDWRERLQLAIEGLETQAPASPAGAEEAYLHARLRLLRLAAGDAERAVEPLGGLPAAEQAYWSKQTWAMAALLDAQKQPDRRRRAATALAHQADATARMSELATLRVRNLAFCGKVYGYGAYEAVESTRFRAGESLAFYAEVENYRSESTASGYRTVLATGYRVVGPGGDVVDSGDFPPVEDVCLSQRRDFHIEYRVTLPKGLASGEHRLELTVTDELGDKIAEDALVFDVVGR